MTSVCLQLLPCRVAAELLYGAFGLETWKHSACVPGVKCSTGTVPGLASAALVLQPACVVPGSELQTLLTLDLSMVGFRVM